MGIKKTHALMAVTVEVRALAVESHMTLVSAGLTLDLGQVRAGRGEVAGRSVGLPAALVGADQRLADVAPRLGLTVLGNMAAREALGALLGLEATLSQMSELVADSALSGLTDLRLVAVALAVVTEPALVSSVANLVATVALRSLAVILSVAVLLASLTVPALLGRMSESTAVLAGDRLALVVEMTTGTTSAAGNLGALLEMVARFLAVGAVPNDLNFAMARLGSRT